MPVLLGESHVDRLLTIADSIDVQVAELRDAAGRADVLVTATGSAEPVFDGAWLRPGTHVNAVESNLAGKRELDEQAIRPVELGAVAAGLAPGRSSPEGVTMFESHGLVLEGLACVRITSRAKRAYIGAPLPD
jgi:alanine dehydrogenase